MAKLQVSKVLKVRAVGDSLVHNFNAMQVGRLQFVGRKFDKESDEFVILPDGEEVTFRAEYIQAVQAGELEALDDETCKLCGLPPLAIVKVSKK